MLGFELQIREMVSQIKIELNVVSAFTLIKHEHRIITTKLWLR